ncbi:MULTISPECIES: TolC family protein [unclassified Helicobacter]|uniref:TolC family protein n=1 Tax=unclassified Helicobacter TaxID=2593540 RepID=UPI000CF02D34|nr:MULTISPECIES: TolC family protein [unclassified Helicobacter]
MFARNRVVFFKVLFIASFVFAQSQQDIASDLSIMSDIQKMQKNVKDKYTLKELIKASDSNYSIQAKVLSVVQAKRGILVAKGMFLPSLDLDYSFQNVYRNTQTDSQYDMQNANAKLKLNLFNGLADLNTVREKNATYLSTLSDEEYTRQSIYLQVLQQYYGYFDNLSKLISLQKKLEQISSDVQRVEKLYSQGLTPIDNLESLRAQASLSKYQIADAQMSVEQNKLMLEYLTNLKIGGLIYEKMSLPEFKIQDRSDIVSLRQQINAQIFQNKQLHYFPTVDLNNTFTYNIQKPAYVSRNPAFSALYPDMQNVVSITVTLKLLDDVGLTFQKQYLKAGQLANEKLLAYKRLEQKKDEELYRKTLEIAKKKIQSARDNLKSANIAYANIKKKYEANLINFTDYLQALSTKFDAESTFNQSLNNYELQKANYIFYSGQKIKDFIKE